MTPDFTIVGLLVAGISALFGVFIKLIYDSLKAKDAEIARIQAAAAADKLWLQAQLESWATIGRTAVSGLEKLTEKSP